MEIVVEKTMSWDQLVETWYQKAAQVPGWDAAKYPRVASVYEMKNAENQVIT
jgi:hypothetical protein